MVVRAKNGSDGASGAEEVTGVLGGVTKTVSNVACTLFSSTRGWVATGLMAAGGYLVVTGPKGKGSRSAAVAKTVTGLVLTCTGVAMARGQCQQPYAVIEDQKN